MTDCDSCGGSPLDASKDQTEGESQLDSLLDEIDEINGANDRDGATDQDAVRWRGSGRKSSARTMRQERKRLLVNKLYVFSSNKNKLQLLKTRRGSSQAVRVC